MFENLLRRLLTPAPDRLDATDAPLALAALLVRVARADGHYTEAERARIDRVLTRLYALSPFAAADLQGRAAVLEAEAPDTVRFTRALKEAVPLDDRAGLIEALWSVALSDGSRGEEEDQVIRLVASLLGLTDRDSALARQRSATQG